MAQIRSVVSESLQSTIRRLLPSQQGFTEDLQATNVIQPIIDLTPTAEGDTLEQSLAQAIAFENTSFRVNNTTTTIVNNSGFYRVFGSGFLQQPGSGADRFGSFQISNGLTNKVVWETQLLPSSAANAGFPIFDFVICLGSGESFLASTTNASVVLAGSTRQIADVNGNLIDPVGFQSQ